jgi:D-alanyl-D-alanine carboxypeptidase/D-alanyl-D-alanine-endopeptidase (penicillin-binding protein 4)
MNLRRIRHFPFLLLVCCLLLATGAAGALVSKVRGSSGEETHVLTAAKAIAIPKISDDLPPHREPPPPSPSPSPPPPPPPPPPVPPPNPVKAAAGAVLAALQSSGAPRLAAVVDVDGTGRILSYNANLPMVPASTQKLFTGAAALSVLGPDYKFKTTVQRTGVLLPGGTLDGDLILVGGGDPTLAQADLTSLASQVHGGGISTVKGSLLADDSRYDRVRDAPGWKPGFIPKEIGPLSALAVDENWYRIDPAYISDPVAANLDLFRSMLAAAGVGIEGGNSGAGLGAADIAAEHQSKPLSEILQHTLKESDNFEAEMILKEMGRTKGAGTTASGLQAVAGFASGISAALGRAVDGSGLSQDDSATGAQEVGWLEKTGRLSIGGDFFNELAVSCTDPGTLKKRLCGTPAAGKVFAKTGSLSHVATITGYTTTANGHRVTFSFLLSGYAYESRARVGIDNALLTLVALSF